MLDNASKIFHGLDIKPRNLKVKNAQQKLKGNFSKFKMADH